MRERERGFLKKIAHGIIEAGKSKICRMGWQAGDLRRANVAVEVQRPSAGRILSCLGEISLCSTEAFNGWMRTSKQIMEDNLLYAKSTDLNIGFTLTETSRIMFEQILSLWPHQVDT